MVLKRIIFNEVDDDQVIVLSELDGSRSLPIVIGLFEATSIDRRIKQLPTPRPLTHDLIVASIAELGAKLQDILIDDLRESTFYAKLRIRHEGRLREVDCRPSDAVAVAVCAKVPIFVNESVLGDAEVD